MFQEAPQGVSDPGLHQAQGGDRQDPPRGVRPQSAHSKEGPVPPVLHQGPQPDGEEAKSWDEEANQTISTDTVIRPAEDGATL